MRARALLPIVFPFLLACSTPVPDKVPEITGPAAQQDLFTMLQGDWQEIQDGGNTVFHEQWHSDADGQLTGLGFVLSGNDTVFIEYLQILRSDTGTWYSAVIPSQNDGQPVFFGLAIETDSLVFTNPQHDFPQRITYVPDAGNGWHVYVSGTRHNAPHAEHFHFTKRSVSRPDMEL